MFGAVARNNGGQLEFVDWWAHDRAEEKIALEGFIDWVHARWRSHPGMHIYHYAAYEVCAVRRLSTRHDTRQNEVDDLLRNNVFVDLYQIVRHSLRIGEGSYSIKQVERLYRGKRNTDVASGGDSIVQYATWIDTKEPRNWLESRILKGIRDYNEDDCRSTAVAQIKDITPEAQARQDLADKLRQKSDETSRTLGDLIDFHRREQKPVWWRMFDRASATPEELRDVMLDQH